MRKVALVFLLAVFVPSLVLAWLAIRSLRDEQFLLERQRSLLYQGVADAKAKAVQDALAEFQHTFSRKVSTLLHDRKPLEAAKSFDELLNWPLAQVGFAVTLDGQTCAPSPYGRPEARTFLAENTRFLGNRESAQVYWNTKQAQNPPAYSNSFSQMPSKGTDASPDFEQRYGLKSSTRNVIPQQQLRFDQNEAPQQAVQLSKIAPAETEFRQLIGNNDEGALARFVDNELNVLFWCRPPEERGIVFGAQLSLTQLVDALKPLLTAVEPPFNEEICVALLDDSTKPVALSHAAFHATWKRPFVATEIGEILPHWEIAVYILNPQKLAASAQALKYTLGLLVALLVLAIGIGSWLIVRDLNRQLTLAREKTDFVSNVSHELKTPLTSIRMFSELLAEGRVNEPAKQRSYLSIITAEAARLTRLINNVLDFARLERGEKKYNFEPCDLVALVSDTARTYRPHLESNGFHFECEWPDGPIPVKGDRDALAQIVVNLLSNAEKYSGSQKEILLRVRQQSAPLPHAEVSILDRGLGVPRGSEEKVFEKFYRAHDSLSSGIQGSGLGLTLARQIARAHGGDIVYEPREGGGSVFSLRLPLATT